MTDGSTSSRSPETAVPVLWLVACRGVLQLYPPRIRRELGAEIAAVFAHRLRRSARSGRLALAGTGLAELFDLARHALLQRLGGGSLSRSPQHRFRRQRDMVGTLLSDVRYAWRALRRRPAFCVVVVAILAIGIGASTAIFTVFDSAVLNPLPFRNAHQIVEMWRGLEGGNMVTSWEQGMIRFWRETGALEQVVGWDYEEVDLTGVGEPRPIPVARVDPELMGFLGVRPEHGRDLVQADGLEGAEAVVLVSRALARQLAATAEEAVGERLELDGVAYRVAGVMPSGFTFPFQGVQAWLPVAFIGEGSRMAELRPRLYARVSESVDPDVVAERANTLAAAANLDARLVLRRPVDLWGRTKGALSLLLVGVALLVLSACANTANLQLASFTEREREVALRTALGGGRGRLLRQSLIESLLLATLGGLVGTGVAYGLLAVVMDTAPREVALFTANAVDIDLRALGFTFALSLATAVLFGAVPAWRGTRQDPGQALAGARGSTDSRNRRLRHGLVVAEVALAVVLLSGAALLSASLVRLIGNDLGHDEEGIFVLKIRPATSRYATPAERLALGQSLATRMRAIPGVEGVALGSGLPVDGVDSFSFGIAPEGEGEPVQEPDPTLILPTIRVDSEYFATLGIPLVAGRGFLPEEVGSAEQPVVLGRSLAERYFAGGAAVGRRFRLRADEEWMTVVGVAGEVRTMGLDEPLGPMELYRPVDPGREMDRIVLMVRAPEAPADRLVETLRAAVTAEDPLQPVESITTVERAVWNQLSTERFYLSLAGTFALAAAMLAALGIYGVISYTVAQRTREIGIRVALGAQRRDIRRLMLRLGAGLAAAGVGLGLLVSSWVTGALEAYLHEVQPGDPGLLALVGGVMLALALTATWLPARRALRIDPMEALRSD